MKGIIFTFLFVLLISISAVRESSAYPRFSAYTGEKCQDCHVDPAGGSMRHGGGIAYAKNNLTMDMFKKIAGKTEFSPKITNDISIGGDVFVTQVDDQNPGSTNFNSFLIMQGDLYVNAKLNKILNVFLTSGVQIPGIETEYGVYGMLSKLPAESYFKVGRFKPNYGLRIVEHRAYQRKILWNDPYDYNTGFELGLSPDWFNFNVGLYNPMNTDFLTIDPHKMVVASTDFNFGFSDNDFNVNVGASFFNNPYNTRDSAFTTTIAANSKAWGGFARIGIVKRIALLGEVDFEEIKTDFPLKRRMYSFAELNVIVVKGFEIRGQYERYDMDRNIENDHVTRYSAGVAAFPFFGFETDAMVRFVTEEPSTDNDEFQWNFHFYF